MNDTLIRLARRNALLTRALYSALDGDLGLAERLVALDALAESGEWRVEHHTRLLTDYAAPCHVVTPGVPHSFVLARITIEPAAGVWIGRIITRGYDNYLLVDDVAATSLDSVLPPRVIPAGSAIVLEIEKLPPAPVYHIRFFGIPVEP